MEVHAGGDGDCEGCSGQVAVARFYHTQIRRDQRRRCHRYVPGAVIRSDSEQSP